MAKYYALVAGLREYTLDAENKGFDAPAIVAEVREQLSASDRRTLDLFYAYYDIQNIINMLAARTQFSELGTLTREELEQDIRTPSRLPKWLGAVLATYSAPDDPEWDEVDRTRTIEKALWTAYYRECAKSKSRFTREWYEFDRNLRNVSAALTARRLGFPVSDETVGEGYVAEALGRSSAADFGLRGELEYIDRVMAAVGEEGNLIDKERMIDRLRWETAGELTTFNYFDLDAVLGYLARVNIIHRWASLDPAQGREMFQKLLADMDELKIDN